MQPSAEPILSDVSGAVLELGPLHQLLQSGRWVVVEGERSDIAGVRGVRASELMMVAGLEHGYDPYLPGDRPHTTLHLATSLANTYYRDGLRIHANVVPASHGESRSEVLGSSDARQPMQRFALRQPPLTWRPAPTAAGAASTLKVLVDGVQWQEAANLAALSADARAFVTLTGDDGVTQGDWNLKYDYAVTTLNSFGNARDYINNLRELRGADWGGRQAPGDRSIFDFHREEFADFKSKWEKDRGADTYVEFLDPGKRKDDFKREKDSMDEVKEYMDKHPTYFPGYNDWVLEL